MGMSASQVRYCMLVGRKSDIEYQGQQINQQRTTLATQSSAYNTQMLTLKVPTPPSSEEYTINTYEYLYNGKDCTITGINFVTDAYQDEKGNEYDANTYVVNYTTQETKDLPSRGYTYTVLDNTTTATYKVQLNSKTYELNEINKDSKLDKDVIQQCNESKIREEYSFEEDEKFYYAEVAAGNYIYFAQSDLNSETKLAQAYTVSAKTQTVSEKMYGANILWTDTGRMTAIIDKNGQTCSLSVKTTTDEDAYNEAYNEYLYQKDQYNKAIDDINANLEAIQAQDKKLELQLTNLDTQQNAIKTEMDAVKKVTQDNIEKSFNVFG